MALTQKQRDLKAQSLRRIAGKLLVNYRNQDLPQVVREELKVAHDAVCRAFDKLEDNR